MNYTLEQEALWNEIVQSFQEDMPGPSFNMWIRPLKLYAVSDTEVMVTIEDSNAQAQIGMMQRYHSRIETAVRARFGMRYSFRILDKEEIEKQKMLISETMLNPKYTFDNFVIGDSNKFAYMASLTVAEQPNEAYNPLFIYGDVGLGKTHLMNAIGNFIIQQNPVARIMLTTSERFANELIEAIAKKRGTSDLRAKMRNVDVLMVDDIQFLSKTTASQEEFFHTFNELQNSGKQIVISADRPPNEMPTIEERLRSRFGSGLIVDIRKPDFETRVAILMRKAKEEGVDIPADVREYIAAHFDKSIRELEGALTGVIAKSRLLGYPISMELARNALGDLEQTQDTRVVTPAIVMDVISKKMGVTVDEILSPKRSRSITLPRQISMYICRELTDLSTTTIGKEFGGRDHTTVMHSCDKIEEQMKSDYSFKKKIDELISLVKAN